MKITHVRYGVLVTTENYCNAQAAAEAIVEEGEDAKACLDRLRQYINTYLGKAKEEHGLDRILSTLQEQVESAKRLLESLRAEVAANRKIIRDHEQLAVLATKHGIDPQGLDDGMPF